MIKIEHQRGELNDCRPRQIAYTLVCDSCGHQIATLGIEERDASTLQASDVSALLGQITNNLGGVILLGYDGTRYVWCRDCHPYDMAGVS